MINMSREPFLGRRPAWMIRREVGQQAKFDAQPAQFAREVARRETVIRPDGQRYSVRPVKRPGCSVAATVPVGPAQSWSSPRT